MPNDCLIRVVVRRNHAYIHVRTHIHARTRASVDFDNLYNRGILKEKPRISHGGRESSSERFKYFLQVVRDRGRSHLNQYVGVAIITRWEKNISQFICV